MAFTGSLWGRRVQAIGQAPVATATGFVALFTLDNFQGNGNEIVNGGSNSALNGGGDIRVSTDDAGSNQLPLQIVRFTVSATPSLQEIQFWVRFDSYEAANREVYVFYNRAGQTQPPVTDAFGRNSVWQDYESVLHCEDTSWTDSTGNGDLTPDGSTPPTVVDTTLGRAYRFTQGDGTSLERALSSAITSGPVTLQSTFVNTLNPSTVFFVGGVSGAPGGQDFSIGGRTGNSNKGVGAFVPTNQSIASNVVGERGEIGDEYNLTVTLNGSNLDFYAWVNGVQATINNTVTTTINLVNVGLGGRIDGSPNYYTFDVASFRLLTLERSQDFLNLENANQLSTSTFWTMGEPEDTGGATGITVSVTESLNTYQDNNTVSIQTNVNVSVTESLNAYADSVGATITPQVNVDVTVTEFLNSYTDSSNVTLTEAGNISATVTESLKSYQDASVVDIQRNIELTVTEALNSYSDDASVRIAKEVSAQVTEVLNSYIDSASMRLPTQWVDKTPAQTDWAVKTKVTTIWSDK